MQCFICVTYMIILCSAHPAKDKQIAAPHQKKSLFRDVIESLRIRAQLPEDFNQNEDNNLSQNDDKYGYDNEPPHLPSDADFIPRRNDRIEMPTLPLKYRFPKSLNDTEGKMANVTTEEIVVFVDTDKITKTTQKPKKQKRPQTSNKNKVANKNKENEDQDVETPAPLQDNTPVSNTLSGNSQIGNRESQTVVKPTVIVNFRGSLTHQDSDIRLEKRNDNDTDRTAQNIFNINQEVNFEPVKKDVKKGSKVKVGDVRQTFNIVTDVKAKVEEEMLMCETATWNPKRNVREGRKRDNVLQILFSL